MKGLDVHRFRNLDILIRLEHEMVLEYANESVLQVPLQYGEFPQRQESSDLPFFIVLYRFIKQFINPLNTLYSRLRILFTSHPSGDQHNHTVTPVSFKGHNETLKRTFIIHQMQIEINSGHGYRRSGHKKGSIRDIGTMDEIECAIHHDFSIIHQTNLHIPYVPKYIERTILVNGKLVGYRLTQTPDHIKRVSTYYPK